MLVVCCPEIEFKIQEGNIAETPNSKKKVRQIFLSTKARFSAYMSGLADIKSKKIVRKIRQIDVSLNYIKYNGHKDNLRL